MDTGHMIMDTVITTTGIQPIIMLRIIIHLIPISSDPIPSIDNVISSDDFIVMGPHHTLIRELADGLLHLTVSTRVMNQSNDWQRRLKEGIG